MRRFLLWLLPCCHPFRGLDDDGVFCPACGQRMADW
jgi:hypothetical protein